MTRRIIGIVLACLGAFSLFDGAYFWAVSLKSGNINVILAPLGALLIFFPSGIALLVIGLVLALKRHS